MSITLTVWLLAYLCFAALSAHRPIWGVALYCLSYFGDPASWWWGVPIVSIRWNLIASIIAIASVLIHHPPRFKSLSDAWMELILGLMALNATAVHFVLAEDASISLRSYDLLLKFSVLAFLIKHAIRTKSDFMIMLVIITVALGHIGYEVKVNDAGRMIKGRLEGVGPPTANSSNQLACLLVTTLPLIGTLALTGESKQRLLAWGSAPFAVNTLLLCNSRAAFLALILAAPVYLVLAPQKARRIAFGVVLLGTVGTLFLLRDPQIVARFMTTFKPAEERDASATSRLDYWKAGLDMLQDYPLGSGGDGYKLVHGWKYRAEYGSTERTRSVHNGFINEACEWGIQGAALRILLTLLAIAKAFLVANHLSRGGDYAFGLVGAAIVAGLVAFCITSVFGDHFDDEWGLWMVALAAAYESLFRSGVVGSGATQLVWYRLVPLSEYTDLNAGHDSPFTSARPDTTRYSHP